MLSSVSCVSSCPHPKLASSWLYSLMLSMLSPCHAQQTGLLYRKPVSAWKAGNTNRKAASTFISWTGTYLGSFFVPDMNHISLRSWCLKWSKSTSTSVSLQTTTTYSNLCSTVSFAWSRMRVSASSCVVLNMPGSWSGEHFTVSGLSNPPAVTMSPSATWQHSSSDSSLLYFLPSL